MRKLGIALVALLVVSTFAWQNRISLMVWGAPKIRDLIDPIPPNQSFEWDKGPETADTSPDQRPPNIILVLTDDMGFNDISLYNGGAADGTLKIPHIDALAEQGVRFNNGYAANAVCAPSRATILTGPVLYTVRV